MFERSVVIYGTGGEAKEAAMDGKISDKIICMVGRGCYSDTDSLKEFPLRNDACLNAIDVPFDMIIASQYFDIIYDRLRKEGKLSNKYLTNIYVPNLMGRKPPYDTKETAELTEGEWLWLEENIAEDSKELLLQLKKERTNPSYPSSEYLAFEDGLYHAGFEDYWDTIKGRRVTDHAVVVDAGAYTGDTIARIVENIGGSVDAYYALEPMQENYSVLCEGRYQGIRSFRPLCSALGSREAEFVFSNSVEHADAFSINPESSYTSNGSMNSQTVQMITLDSMNLSREADYFLKMDIEGSEMEALMGGVPLYKRKASEPCRMPLS